MSDLRQACDRCHDKKLRCPKLPGSLTCGRCAKAAVPCTFSPPTRPPFTHHHAQPLAWPDTTDFHQQMNSVTSHFDPSFAGFPAVFASPDSNTVTEGEAAPPQPSQDDASTPDETSQLADLMVALDGVTRVLPQNKIRHLSREHVQQWADHMQQSFGLQSTLEHILKYSQRLVTLYPLVLEAAAPKPDPVDLDNVCSVPDCVHNYSSPQLTPPWPSPSPSLDHALLNLLLACHIKLLDIIDILIDNGRFCGHVTSYLPGDSEPKFDIPLARIGSFVAPAGAAASMFICMLVELHALLVAKSGDLASLAASSVTSSRESQVVSLQCEILQDRTNSIMDELSKFKDYMLKRGMVR